MSMRLHLQLIISLLLVSQSALIAQEAFDTIPLQDSIIVTPDTIQKQVDEKLVSIIGVGDIMLGTNFPHPKYMPSQNGDSLMKGLYPFLSDASISFGNLEGAFSDSLPITKRCQDTANCFSKS